MITDGSMDRGIEGSVAKPKPGGLATRATMLRLRLLISHMCPEATKSNDMNGLHNDTMMKFWRAKVRFLRCDGIYLRTTNGVELILSNNMGFCWRMKGFLVGSSTTGYNHHQTFQNSNNTVARSRNIINNIRRRIVSNHIAKTFHTFVSFCHSVISTSLSTRSTAKFQ